METNGDGSRNLKVGQKENNQERYLRYHIATREELANGLSQKKDRMILFGHWGLGIWHRDGMVGGGAFIALAIALAMVMVIFAWFGLARLNCWMDGCWARVN
ncbi:predicted protein [Sclerotinia sclerotiorum 1980 UF-70]|uniref:Uncharacterized protein n=1 Tax=Sclerotinia sclerotiorum (strain ATCC 18683 / 1980 / Ss-1) TaxID=665079 RepID=A7F4N7_SCLS1|nr:predicted protein [Sclerotinia sclerotiorum 1980 UF-70]EDN97708.1 predicted protein [Sclerotinia sclerotiorum 1980 UF-70]